MFTSKKVKQLLSNLRLWLCKPLQWLVHEFSLLHLGKSICISSALNWPCPLLNHSQVRLDWSHRYENIETYIFRSVDWSKLVLLEPKALEIQNYGRVLTMQDFKQWRRVRIHRRTWRGWNRRIIESKTRTMERRRNKYRRDRWIWRWKIQLYKCHIRVGDYFFVWHNK